MSHDPLRNLPREKGGLRARTISTDDSDTPCRIKMSVGLVGLIVSMTSKAARQLA